MPEAASKPTLRDATLAVRQGFEPGERDLCKLLMARSLWHNVFVSLHLPSAIESTRVLSSLLESTGVMEE